MLEMPTRELTHANAHTTRTPIQFVQLIARHQQADSATRCEQETTSGSLSLSLSLSASLLPPPSPPRSLSLSEFST